VEKYCTAGQATDDNNMRRLRIAWWAPKAIKTHTQNIQYLFLFHCSSGYMNTPKYCIYKYIACIVGFNFLVTSIHSVQRS